MLSCLIRHNLQTPDWGGTNEVKRLKSHPTITLASTPHHLVCLHISSLYSPPLCYLPSHSLLLPAHCPVFFIPAMPLFPLKGFRVCHHTQTLGPALHSNPQFNSKSNRFRNLKKTNFKKNMLVFWWNMLIYILGRVSCGDWCHLHVSIKYEALSGSRLA